MGKKIIILTNAERILHIFQRAAVGLPAGTEISCIPVSRGTAWDRSWEERLACADAVLAKWMGGSVLSFWREAAAFLRAEKIPYGLIANQEEQAEEPFGIEPSVMERIRGYLFYSGEENFRNLILYLRATLSGEAVSFAEPEELHWSGIYHPGMPSRCMTSPSDYEAAYCKAGRPSVGILFYRDAWLWGDTSYMDALIGEIERQGMNAVCVFANGRPDTALGMPGMRDLLRMYFTKDGKPFVSVILNTMKFALTATGDLQTAELAAFGVPIFEAYTLMSEYEEWKASEEGMTPMAVSISVALPEFDGSIHGVPIAARHREEDGGAVYEPIEDRIGRMVRRAKKWAALREKPNHEKKIAIIFHNYPAKNSNIGSAAGLDSIESVIRLLARMKREGYDVAAVPESREALLAALTSHATNDRAFLTDAQAEEAVRLSRRAYLDFWKTLSPAVREKVEARWGKAPGDYLLGDDGALLLPGYFDGNIFLTVQPSRGGPGADAEAIYHNLHEPPTHQYLAFYDWLLREWGADAVIHMGTHGTQEWLPGKGVAQDADSFGDITIADLPNLYPYFMTIAGEGIQAKRRGSAALIGYLPAPMTQAGAYEELEELDRTMEEYAKARRMHPEQKESLRRLVLEKTHAAKLDADLPYKDGEDFDAYFDALHNVLEDVEESAVHTGLHIFGTPPAGEELVQYILQILRLPHGEVPSLTALFAGRLELSEEMLTKTPSEFDLSHGMTYGALLKKIHVEAECFVRRLSEGKFTAEAQAAAVTATGAGSEEWKGKLFAMAHFICDALAPRLAETAEEEDHLLDGLSGRYIEPGPSGAPSSGGIAFLPSGRNFYGTDPRTMPTPAAWEIGKKLADGLIERFIREEGHYPENIGLILWSGPNMRSSGEDIAEILYLLGVKPVWQSGTLHVQDLCLMQPSELKRPRLDVTCRISGLFRDTLSPLIELIDKAVLLAAGAEETDEQNFLRKHVRADSAELLAAGNAADEAWRSAAYRIFGNARGAYGAGVSNLLESKEWQDEKDLARVYIRWGAHAYGGGRKGVFLPGQFKKRLSSMELTVKNDDTHEMNLLSSDDYNAFHGGMIAAVKAFRGTAPQSYEGDSSDPARPVMRSVAEEMKRVFRSEAMNPKYIEGMKKYGYKGAADMANLLAHSFAWDATSGVMDDWMYDGYARKYALDPEMQKWMRRVNPWAQQRIAETLLEASQRGMWKASPEMEAELRDLYLSIEGELEDDGDDDD